MQVSLDRNLFLSALQRQQNIVDRKTTVPILNHVLFSISQEEVKITGTDLDMTLEEVIPAQVSDGASFALSAHLVYEVVRRCSPNHPVTMRLGQKDVVVLKSGKSCFELPMMPADQYPSIPAQEKVHEFSVTAREMLGLLDQTRFAMSQEEARFYLNGLYFHVADQNLRAVGTDAHRLALSWIALPPQAEKMPGMILSRKTVSEFRRLLDKSEEDVHVTLMPTQGMFRIGSVSLCARFVNGTYPQYAEAIPKQTKTSLTLETLPFYQAIDRVSVMTTQEKSKPVQLKFQEGSVTFSAVSTLGGSSTEVVAALYQGAPFSVSFNGRYLLDVLQQIKGATFTLSFNDSEKPFVIRDCANEQALYVLMPIHGV